MHKAENICTPLRALRIDPEKKRIEILFFDPDYQLIAPLISTECGIVSVRYDLTNGDMCLAQRLQDGAAEGGSSFTLDQNIRVYGRALVVGFDDSGEIVDALISIEDLESRLRFETVIETCCGRSRADHGSTGRHIRESN